MLILKKAISLILILIFLLLLNVINSSAEKVIVKVTIPKALSVSVPNYPGDFNNSNITVKSNTAWTMVIYNEKNEGIDSVQSMAKKGSPFVYENIDLKEAKRFTFTVF